MLPLMGTLTLRLTLVLVRRWRMELEDGVKEEVLQKGGSCFMLTRLMREWHNMTSRKVCGYSAG
jgi:hypothetical protein